jgi:uncharacterized membrane protein YkvA (DUF1232 family)
MESEKKKKAKAPAGKQRRTRTVTKNQAAAELDRRAKKVTDADVGVVLDRADEIRNRFESTGPLGRFVKDVKLTLAIVKDYWSGAYREIPWWTIAAVVAALIYVINPIDLIPDAIPVIGELDDAAVVAACLLLVEQDLHQYEAWKTDAA